MKYIIFIFLIIFCGCASKSHLCQIQDIQEMIKNTKTHIGKKNNGVELKSIKCENGVVIVEYNVLPNSEIAEQISSGVQDLFSEKFDCQTTIIKNGLDYERIFIIDEKNYKIRRKPYICEYKSKNNMFLIDMLNETTKNNSKK